LVCVVREQREDASTVNDKVDSVYLSSDRLQTVDRIRRLWISEGWNCGSGGDGRDLGTKVDLNSFLREPFLGLVPSWDGKSWEKALVRSEDHKSSWELWGGGGRGRGIVRAELSSELHSDQATAKNSKNFLLLESRWEGEKLLFPLSQWQGQRSYRRRVGKATTEEQRVVMNLGDLSWGGLHEDSLCFKRDKAEETIHKATILLIELWQGTDNSIDTRASETDWNSWRIFEIIFGINKNNTNMRN
jgi:hypothetical protein